MLADVAGFIATCALTSGTHLSVIMSMHPNTRLDLSAMYYTNMRCFPQQTRIVGVLRNTSPNKWWFVQFPLLVETHVTTMPSLEIHAASIVDEDERLAALL